jgi:formate/nitrite transporter FocA (FNT family)
MDFRSNEADRIARTDAGDRTTPFPRCDHARRGGWSFDMDYIKPTDVVAAMIDASLRKLALGPRDILIRGALSGALLGAATALAFSGAITTGQPLVGALIFPVSLVMIVLLGLELVTRAAAPVAIPAAAE